MNSISVSNQSVNSLHSCSPHLCVGGQHCMLLKSSLNHTMKCLGDAGVARAILPWDILGVNFGIWVTSTISTRIS